MHQIGNSELIITDKGAIYHLNLRPEQIADTIILVGDQDRVPIISSFFDSIEHKEQHREFRTHTGYYKNKRLTVLSTGIGTDNIDSVVNELDALLNIDFDKRLPKKELKSLNLIRLGTSGAIQPDIPVGSMLISKMTIGFDGLLNFYANREDVTDSDMEEAFIRHTKWNHTLPSPYITEASEVLFNKLELNFITGLTISAPGFYGPQGRVLRLQLVDKDINSKIESFIYKDMKITNFEMESSAIYGLSKQLGHNAVTVCAIIANRVTKDYDSSYKKTVERMIVTTLNSLAN